MCWKNRKQKKQNEKTKKTTGRIEERRGDLENKPYLN